MADKMLIDATHPEETRVVVLRGNRVEEFDFESANRKQLRGNIYLAKVTRVEPSLQAAFIDYGGNRHGFLAFSEIHPDYYQIPVADRQALLDEEARAQKDADDDDDHRSGGRRGGGGRGRHRHRGADRSRNRDVVQSAPVAGEEQPPHETSPESVENPTGDVVSGHETAAQIAETAAAMPAYEPPAYETPASEPEAHDHASEATEANAGEEAAEFTHHEPSDAPLETIAEGEQPSAPAEGALTAETAREETAHEETAPAESGNGEEHHEEEAVESVGGADALEEARMPRFRRQYKIQEVIKRRQVMLVQVVKEERGTKGAALTTYLSLAGRYSVLMPNTARGGGISRKITSGEDRSRLKEIAGELEVPQGMGVILRTAGASRTKTEVKRDFEYLLRLWETVRDLTLKSMAPKLVYEEGSLTKRSIRDLYSKDIEEIIVSGDEGYKEAREFMRMLMPSHAKHVKLYNDAQPLFTRYGIESQLDAMFTPTVQLRSGGYIVINQTEALVAIDVNSGRATREHHIEDTAVKTNGEAAEEIARQLRLRDLAGLIVIDFIDMDESRNNRTVERRMKDALKHDRARIQVGHISHFGLLEMSRQRIRTSVLESSTEKCPVCGGSGHVRSVSSVALQLLRAIEETLIKGATHNLIVRTRSEVALYVLNHKRAHLRDLEDRFHITITISADPTVNAQVSYIVDRGEQMHTAEAAKAIAAVAPAMPASALEADEDVLDDAAEAESDDEEETETPSTDEAEAPDHMPAEAAGEAPHSDGEQQGGRGGERDGDRGRRRRRGRGRGRSGEGRGGEGRGGEGWGGEGRGPRDSAQPFAQNAAPEQLGANQFGANEESSEASGDDGEGQQSHQGGASLGPDGEVRRRRRRGRRGGRRNRQGRNGEAPFQGSGNGGEPRETELNPRGADFPPVSEEDASGIAPPFEQTQAAAPAAIEAAPMASAPQEARRRSTTREPAPFSGASAAPSPSPTLPPPAPVISSTASEEGGTPKRGWWAKKLLGDKS